jgi:hypothetical protein
MPPLWLVALIVAAAAPFCAAALQAALEARLRGRTRATLERAISTADHEKESGGAGRPEVQ